MTSLLCTRCSYGSSESKVWTIIPKLISGLTIWTKVPVNGPDYLSSAPHTNEGNCCAHLDLSSRGFVNMKLFPSVKTFVGMKMFVVCGYRDVYWCRDACWCRQLLVHRCLLMRRHLWVQRRLGIEKETFSRKKLSFYRRREGPVPSISDLSKSRE